MPWLRFYARSFGLGALLGGALVVLRLLPVFVRDARRRSPWRQRIQRFTSGTSARLLGMRIRVEGTPPDGPALLVSNHLSYLDILLWSAVLGPVFVSKHDVVELPLVGPLAEALETVFVDRGRRTEVARVSDAMEHALGQGERVLLFPEGTTGSGATVRRFHAPLFKPSLRLSMPVHCAAIRYEARPGQPAASDSLAWHGGMSLGAHARRMMRLPGFDAVVSFVPEPVAADRRKELAQRCQEAVAAVFVPLPEGTWTPPAPDAPEGLAQNS